MKGLPVAFLDLTIREMLASNDIGKLQALETVIKRKIKNVEANEVLEFEEADVVIVAIPEEEEFKAVVIKILQKKIEVMDKDQNFFTIRPHWLTKA